MNWIESIHIRSGEDQTKSLLASVPALIEGIHEKRGFRGISVLTNAIFDSDLLIVLKWTKNETPAKSLEGLAIAEHMKKCGVVNHGLWIQHKCDCLLENLAEN